jgi:hypothetical protein
MSEFTGREMKMISNLKLSFLVSLMAWISVFTLGFLAATRSVLVDGLLIGYWIFCLFVAWMAGIASMQRKE